MQLMDAKHTGNQGNTVTVEQNEFDLEKLIKLWAKQIDSKHGCEWVDLSFVRDNTTTKIEKLKKSGHTINPFHLETVTKRSKEAVRQGDGVKMVDLCKKGTIVGDGGKHTTAKSVTRTTSRTVSLTKEVSV